MGLDYSEAVPEPIPEKPKCAKCHKELKSNNQYSCENDKTICGDCHKLYLSYITKFFDS